MKRLIYYIGRPNEEEALRMDFSDGLSRPVHERIELGFIPMKLPIMDVERYRIFNSAKEYRKWANRNLPSWLGYYSKDDR
jgi:hypothetical protein